MANQLTNYLANFKAEKGGKITHTRIGDMNHNIYGGSYNIPDENYLEFMELYYNWVIVAGNDEYLTEKQEDVVALDFDFRYDHSIDTRQHTPDHIIDCLVLYAEIIGEIMEDITTNTTIKAYVLEKPNVNRLDNKTKDGIHVILGLRMPREAQVILRDLVLPRLKNIWDDLPLTNAWDDIIDEGVVKASVNWQLIGSHKPQNETYALTSIYDLICTDAKQNYWDVKNTKNNNTTLTFDQVMALSVRNKNAPNITFTNVKPAHKEAVMWGKRRLEKRKTTTPPPDQNNNNKDIKNDNAEIIEILDNIDSKYWSDFESWKKLIMAINSVFDNKKTAEELAIFYSKKTTNDNYDQEAVLKLLEAEHSKITIGTICYYSKLSNKDNFYKIKAKYHVVFDNTDYEIAQTYIKLIGDNIKITDNTPYIYEGRLWVMDQDKKKIQRNIVRTLLEFYEKCNARYSGLLKHTETGDANYDKYTKTLKQILELLVSIKGDKKQNNILKQVLLFIEEDKTISFDKIKPYYFVFNNIAFDMKTGQEVKISKYDYITQSTGYDYIKPTKEQVDKMKSLIAEILNDNETRKCYLSVLKSCCVGVRQEKFILANGGGRNGKGIISQLMALMLGKEYFYQGNCTTLTQQVKSGANPEIANMHKKRMVMFSEPEENASLFLGVIKSLTGEDTTNARGLYSSNTETALMGTTILEVNGKPNINGKINDSAIERWVNINFRNLYTDNEEIVDNVRIFKQNTLYKEQEWRLEMRCALFQMLLEVEDNAIIIPKSIRDNTLNYLLDNDSIIKWFNQEYKIVKENGNDHIVKAIDLYSHFKEGDFYLNLSKRQKRDEYSKKGFMEKISENVKLKAYFHERKKINGVDYKSILTHTIQLTDYEKGEDDDIKEECNTDEM